VHPAEQHFILSSLSPGPVQKRLALAIVLSMLGVFLLISFGPLAHVKPRRVDAFVPAYVTAMFLCDSITATLLYAQYSITRSVAMLVIASGYLFVALILIPYIMMFPGVFVPGNLLGGTESTSFLWMSQHTGFALSVLAYALLRDKNEGKRLGRLNSHVAIGLCVTTTAAVVLLAAYVCIAEAQSLPRVASDALHFTPLWPYFIGTPVAVATVAALIALWIRRRTVLDLWLMVIMCLYAIEVPLSYHPVPSRFSVGWYAVRVIAILGRSLVLVVLLYEISALYAQLLRAVYAQRREREARLMTGDAVAAAIAHEVRQPLTAMITTADAGWRFLDRASPNLDKAKEAFRRITADGHRAGDIIGNIRATYRRDVRDWTNIDLGELILEALALGHDDLEKHGIALATEAGHEKLPVRGNRVQLQQVLLNLIMNAVDAMASKDQPRVLAVTCSRPVKDRVTVSVADTGSGIPSHEAERIFTPLFTTKSEGMGMGLAICRSIIEAHEGRLWFTANAPRGAQFHFTLPCRE
jgi:signal transduction histidine kinase